MNRNRKIVLSLSIMTMMGITLICQIELFADWRSEEFGKIKVELTDADTIARVYVQGKEILKEGQISAGTILEIGKLLQGQNEAPESLKREVKREKDGSLSISRTNTIYASKELTEKLLEYNLDIKISKTGEMKIDCKFKYLKDIKCKHSLAIPCYQLVMPDSIIIEKGYVAETLDGKTTTGVFTSNYSRDNEMNGLKSYKISTSLGLFELKAGAGNHIRIIDCRAWKSNNCSFNIFANLPWSAPCVINSGTEHNIELTIRFPDSALDK